MAVRKDRLQLIANSASHIYLPNKTRIFLSALLRKYSPLVPSPLMGEGQGEGEAKGIFIVYDAPCKAGMRDLSEIATSVLRLKDIVSVPLRKQKVYIIKLL
jgi:hypothetical protein